MPGKLWLNQIRLAQTRILTRLNLIRCALISVSLVGIQIQRHLSEASAEVSGVSYADRHRIYPVTPPPLMLFPNFSCTLSRQAKYAARIRMEMRFIGFEPCSKSCSNVCSKFSKNSNLTSQTALLCGTVGSLFRIFLFAVTPVRKFLNLAKT